MTVNVAYRDKSDTTVGPSPIIWATVDNQLHNVGDWIHMYEDFVGFRGTVSSNVGQYTGKSGGWISYEDTSTSLAVQATKHGELKYTGTTTDNVEAWLQYGDTTEASFIISDTAADKHNLYFETRIKVDAVTDSTKGWFCGLMQETRAVADTITDAGALADVDFIGFHQPEADGDGIDFVYQKNGGAVQTIVSDITLTAATYIKLGFVVDWHKHVAAERITIYADGAAQTSFVTDTNIAAATFPDGEEMSPIFGVKQATNASHPVYCSFIRCAQTTHNNAV